jgi:hypothetical protein
MDMKEIIDLVAGMPGVLAMLPGPGDGTPELAWGDAFFYYAPDGVPPKTGQPFATIVTKDYPGDEDSRLNRPGAFRVNLFAGHEAFERWTGQRPRDFRPGSVDVSRSDVIFGHPVYGTLGWLAVVNPGPRTEADVRVLLRDAYQLARTRRERREERRRPATP